MNIIILTKTKQVMKYYTLRSPFISNNKFSFK
ncbi:hypothetical protein CKO_01510 [Citrobacter koseri ATCC BAA-895]|uniref:Uncharacterized protein n=1 Tax=Citrobacter koseri (strain ATCC BAA-895 / CDC 4225-83 / SGSC4696) TaxID=290338 RepID=A8AGN0_CITK8|nr:hypothetical protein CKO_01510 [Citrobacter koseri ATCC BAA-895]